MLLNTCYRPGTVLDPVVGNKCDIQVGLKQLTERTPSMGGQCTVSGTCTGVSVGLMDRWRCVGGLSILSTLLPAYFLFSALQIHFMLKKLMLKACKCTQEYSQILSFVNANWLSS